MTMGSHERAEAIVRWFQNEIDPHDYDLLEPITTAIREAEQAARSAALEEAARAVSPDCAADIRALNKITG